jgi:hypothetical protein
MDMEEMEAEIRMLKLRIERNERIKCHFVVARLKRELAQLENEASWKSGGAGDCLDKIADSHKDYNITHWRDINKPKGVKE